MNNAVALAMFYASVQTMAEQQGRAATLARLDLVREWLERINENNGCLSPCGMPGQAASG
jgi:hypothetical protein